MSKREKITALLSEWFGYPSKNWLMQERTDAILAIAYRPSEGDEAIARDALGAYPEKVLPGITEDVARALAEARAEGAADMRERCAQSAEVYVINKGEILPDVPFERLSPNAMNIAHSTCQYVASAIRALSLDESPQTQKSPAGPKPSGAFHIPAADDRL